MNHFLFSAHKAALLTMMATGLLALAPGCIEETEQERNLLPSPPFPRIITIETFAANPAGYDGRVILIRGYLDTMGGWIVIYPDRAAAETMAIDDLAVFGVDSTPNMILSQEGWRTDVRCTEHYVELLGFVERIAPLGQYGITKVGDIRTIESVDFIGPGELCYAWSE